MRLIDVYIHSQVDETGLAHVVREELGGHLDSGEKEGEVSRSVCPEAKLVGEDMTAMVNSSQGRSLNRSRVYSPGQGNEVDAGGLFFSHGGGRWCWW